MAASVSLCVGRLELDCDDNRGFANHSRLFLREDVSPVAYRDPRGRENARPGYSRKLGSVVHRLDLLGYSVAQCQRRFEAALAASGAVNEGSPPSFAAFSRAIASIDCARVPRLQRPGYNLADLAAAVLLIAPETAHAGLSPLLCYERGFYEALDPCILLRLLAENPANLDQNVVWRFQDAIDAGWSDAAALHLEPRPADRYLIVAARERTATILRLSIPLAQAGIADFFDIVDVPRDSDVVAFCGTVAAMRNPKRTLVLLDNDTLGREMQAKIEALALPPQLRVMRLPTLDECRRATTAGPSGRATEDVNGRAVSIECFLDAGTGRTDGPQFRWMAFNAATGDYQGELIARDEVAERFLRGAGKEKGYDFKRLRLLWNALLEACAAIPAPGG